MIDDHVELADDIAVGLRRVGFGVDVAYDGAEGLFKTSIIPYDVVVLDRDMPGVHGDDVCIALANGSNDARILMLTASSAVEDRVEGLGLGADDYLDKPFAFEELVARINSLARRTPSAPTVARWKDLTIDRSRRTVTRAGRSLSLTRKEYGVIEMMVVANGGVVSTEQLLDGVWDEMTDPATRTVTVTISRLRNKLGLPEMIENFIGVGYRLR